MRDLITILTNSTLQLTAQDGCVVLVDPDVPECRFVWTRGQALLMAKIVKSLSLDLSLALRKAADYCTGTHMSAGGGEID